MEEHEALRLCPNRLYSLSYIISKHFIATCSEWGVDLYSNSNNIWWATRFLRDFVFEVLTHSACCCCCGCWHHQFNEAMRRCLIHPDISWPMWSVFAFRLCGWRKSFDRICLENITCTAAFLRGRVGPRLRLCLQSWPLRSPYHTTTIMGYACHRFEDNARHWQYQTCVINTLISVTKSFAYWIPSARDLVPGLDFSVGLG